MTKKMREALSEAHKNPLRRPMKPGPGKPPWPAHPSTIAALERHELVVRTTVRHRRGYVVHVWDVTEKGRLVLYPPPRFREDRPVYMTRGAVRYRKLANGRWTVAASRDSDRDRNEDDYTSDPSRRIDDLEVVPQAGEAWRRRGEAARLGAQDRRVLALRLVRQAKAA